MATPDVDELVRHLRATARAANNLAAHLADVHSIAFEKHVAGLERTSGTAWPPPGVEDAGDPRARALWSRAVDAAEQHMVPLVTLGSDTLNYLSAGRGPADTRGTTISKGEFAGRQRNQRKQAAAGEHVPVRLGEQPTYPGAGR